MSSISSNQLSRDVSRLMWSRVLLCTALLAALGSVVRVPLMSFGKSSSGESSRSSALARTTPPLPSDEPETKPAGQTQAGRSTSTGDGSTPAQAPIDEGPAVPPEPHLASVVKSRLLSPGSTPDTSFPWAEELPERGSPSKAARGVQAASPALAAGALAEWLTGTRDLSGEVAEGIAGAVDRWIAPSDAEGGEAAHRAGDESTGRSPTFADASETADSACMPLLLHNPLQTGGVVHYLVDDQPFSLYPGQWHELSTEAARLIRFDRGADFGEQRLMIRSGVFAFQVSQQRGWELVKQ